MTTLIRRKGDSMKIRVTIGKAIGPNPKRWRAPKGDISRPSRGRYGAIFPWKRVHCFAVVAKIVPGRWPVFYVYGKNIGSSARTKSKGR
jgi:hypothetical protein